MAKILVVDDEENVLFLLREILEKDGHDVIEACDGKEALSKYDERIDLVVTDLVMPDQNGLDLIMELKQKNKNIRIIAISGGGGIDGRFDYIPIAELIGAQSVMRKPFKVDDLKKAVNDLLAS